MEEKKDKTIEAIAKLIELTRNDQLTWESVDSDEVPRKMDEEFIDSVFTTIFDNKLLRLYKRRYKGPSMAAKITSIIGNVKASDLRWYEEIVLELTNESGHSLWSFPKADILKDLLKTIKYKASGADDLISKLLDE